MPKKTKKEKILAEYRRKLKQLYSAQNITTAANIKKTTQQTPLQIQKSSSMPAPILIKESIYQESEYDKSLAKFTIQDLKKTFFISLFILTLEFVIFYANLKGIMK